MTVEREFGPDPEFKRLYQLYLATVVNGGFLWWLIPVVVFLFSLETWIGVLAALFSFVPLIVASLITLYWISKFHSSLVYVLEDDKITIKKGVWWKTKSFVPYNRITNVVIYQGPISRRFDLAKLAIQTAGFSGTTSRGTKVAEAEILGIKNFEEVKDFVMTLIKGMKPVAVEAEAETVPPTDVNQQILQELRRIRRAVEK